MAISPSRRNFLLGSSGLLAASALAACSSGSGGGSPVTPPSGGESPTEVSDPNAGSDDLVPNPSAEDLVGGPTWSPPDLSGQTLVMWGLNYAPHVDRYNALANMFSELTGCEVKVQPQDSPQDALMPAIVGGNAPDVICLMGRMSAQYVKEGGLHALNDEVYAELGIDNEVWWAPDAIGCYTFPDGNIYGVPLESGSGLGNSVVLRTDLYDQLSDDIKALSPWSIPEAEWDGFHGRQFKTWDDLYAVTSAMAELAKDVDPKVWAVNRQSWDTPQLAGLMLQLGTKFWDQDSQTYHFDDGAAEAAIEAMVTYPYSQGYEAKLAGESMIDNFIAGQVAGAVGNGGAVSGAADIGMASQGFLLPSLVPENDPIYASEGGWGFEVPKGSANPELGLEFARFMTTYEAQFCWSQIYGGAPPAVVSLQRSEIFEGEADMATTQRRTTFAGPNMEFWGHGRDPQVEAIISEVIESVRAGDLNPAQAAAELQEKAVAQQAMFNS